MPLRGARVLMVSSEVESLARTGGLGDVVDALSRALAARGADVVVVTPKYGVSRVPAQARWWPSPIVVRLGLGHSREAGVLETRLGGATHLGGAEGGPRACLVADAPLFDRDGIYGDRHGPFGDNAFRFAALSSGALAVAEGAWGGRLPDVVHAHDWHAALSVVYARRRRGAEWARVPTVFTVHNLAYQGVIGPRELGILHVPEDGWTEGWIRHQGQINLMKGAISLADRVTTVSETYAREIRSPAHGCGLDGVLSRVATKLTGIVNGIDVGAFDPAADAAIARRYGLPDARQGKRACKQVLLSELGLDPDLDAPLFAAVSRLQRLKGTDVLLDVVPALVERGARLVLVGTGDTALEAGLRAAAARWSGRVASRIVFDPLLARRVYAGADFFVVPSRDEPCGLTQMYAMHYGAVPIVTPVGGLVDTVEPVDVPRARGTGIVAASPDAPSLLIACEEALALWKDEAGMSSAVSRAMARDSSWTASARRYVDLYEALRPAEGRTRAP